MEQRRRHGRTLGIQRKAEFLLRRSLTFLMVMLGDYESARMLQRNCRLVEALVQAARTVLVNFGTNSYAHP
jgi:hypothetical protein